MKALCPLCIYALFVLYPPGLAFAEDDHCPVEVRWVSVDYLDTAEDIGDDWRVVVVVDGQALKKSLDLVAGRNQPVHITFDRFFKGQKRTFPLPDNLVTITAYATEFDPLMNDYGVGFDSFGPYECGSGKHPVQLLAVVHSLPAWSREGVAMIRLNLEISL